MEKVTRNIDGKIRIGRYHKNGGGFVENTAHVDETAYVGEHCLVLDNAQVLNEAKITEEAKISDNAIIRDKAVIAGGVRIYHNAEISGDVYLRAYNVSGDNKIRHNWEI